MSREHLLRVGRRAALALLIGCGASLAAAEGPAAPGSGARREPTSRRSGAEPPQRMMFRNDLVPGRVTEHRILRTIRRTATRGGQAETVSYRAESRWVQGVMQAGRTGEATLCQMMLDSPTKVLRVFRGGKEVRPAPDAKAFNVGGGSTRLTTDKRTLRDSPALTPLAEGAERVVLDGLLDFAHWPAGSLGAGHRWQRRLETPDFDGTQTLEFVDLVEEDGETAARLTLLVEGRFRGSMDRDWSFGKSQAVVWWSRPNKQLLKMDAQSRYERLRPTGGEEYELKLTVARGESRMLDDGQLEQSRRELAAFGEAMTAEREGRTADARRMCGELRKAGKESLWQPAVVELERRLSAEAAAGSERLSRAQLVEALAKSLVACEAARSRQDYDLLERTTATLRALGADYAATLAKLAKEKDEGRRATAAFGLAFSPRPADVALVNKLAAEGSVKVRSAALAGLAARGEAVADAGVLLALLEDERPAVRRRACLAVGTCVPREHVLIGRVVERIGRVMIHDRDDAVRREAIRALTAIGSAVDVSRMEQALHHELNQENRAELERGIETLRRRT